MGYNLNKCGLEVLTLESEAGIYFSAIRFAFTRKVEAPIFSSQSKKVLFTKTIKFVDDHVRI